MTKGGKTTSSQRTYRPQAGTTAREKRGKSDGGDTCAFSPCLTFRYFWVKPKVRRKLLPALACTKTGQLVSQAATCREIQYSLRPAETKAMIFRAVGSRIGFALRIPPRNDKTSAILRSFCREYSFGFTATGVSPSQDCPPPANRRECRARRHCPPQRPTGRRS